MTADLCRTAQCPRGIRLHPFGLPPRSLYWSTDRKEAEHAPRNVPEFMRAHAVFHVPSLRKERVDLRGAANCLVCIRGVGASRTECCCIEQSRIWRAQI